MMDLWYGIKADLLSDELGWFLVGLLAYWLIPTLMWYYSWPAF